MNTIVRRSYSLMNSLNFPFISQARFKSELHVSRLSFYTTKDELQELFSPFGAVKTRLIIDPETQRPKGFGFAEFESEDEACRALKALNGTVLRGRFILVEFAKERDSALGKSGENSSQLAAYGIRANCVVD